MTPSDTQRLETAIGDLCVDALQRGGNSLLLQVEMRLGVAHRHLDRIRSGVVELTPAVEEEIERSLEAARTFLATTPEGPRAFEDAAGAE